MEDKELIITELTRVRKTINESLIMYADDYDNYICPHIVNKGEMDKYPNRDVNRVRKWFDTQRPSHKLHTQFVEKKNCYVWFSSNKTRVKFLDYLIQFVKDS